MLLTFPWLLASLISLPMLATIYLLRNRFRRHVVSSLMLWTDQAQAREGGIRRSWPHFPLLFYLELLALLLLVAAAAAPLVNMGWKRTPLVVVLDDSFALGAKGTESARDRALAELRKEIERDRHLNVRLIVAGRQPRLLGDPIRSWRQAERQLASWQCQSPTSDLSRAVAFAAEIAGPQTHILVITDVKPENEPEAGRVVWWAVGQKAGNVAIINAARSLTDQQQRCLVEIANLSDQPAHSALTAQAIDAANVSSEGPAALVAPRKMDLDLGPNEVRRLTFAAPVESAGLRLTLPDDALTIDNEVILLPPPTETVRVNLAISHEATRTLVAKVLESTGHAIISATGAQLVIADQSEGPATQTAPAIAPPPTTLPAVSAETWRLALVQQTKTQPFVGPFVIDYGHPLSEGLMLDGIVWSAGSAPAAAGSESVIAAGNVPLLSDSTLPNGAHDLRLYLRPDLSNIQRSPNWPILFWNLLRWRASEFDGPLQTNVRLGAEAQVTLERKARSAQVTSPDGQKRDLTFAGRKLTVPTPLPGLYHVRTESQHYEFAAAALNRDTSDLRDKVTGRWGQWIDPTMTGHDWRDLSWVLLLGAVLLLAVHLMLMAHAAKSAKTGVRA